MKRFREITISSQPRLVKTWKVASIVRIYADWSIEGMVYSILLTTSTRIPEFSTVRVVLRNDSK
jgi:hypothetical protein